MKNGRRHVSLALWGDVLDPTFELFEEATFAASGEHKAKISWAGFTQRAPLIKPPTRPVIRGRQCPVCPVSRKAARPSRTQISSVDWW